MSFCVHGLITVLKFGYWRYKAGCFSNIHALFNYYEYQWFDNYEGKNTAYALIDVAYAATCGAIMPRSKQHVQTGGI